MTNKIIMIAVIGILVIGLVYLGVEVKNLRQEIGLLTHSPKIVAVKQDPSRKGDPFARSNEWWVSLKNRWDPYSELNRIQNQMDRLFHQTFQGRLSAGPFGSKNVYDLSTDIKDAKDKYVINMDIPGMDKNNINVEVENNMLLVSGERNNEKEQKDANFYKQERSFGYFSQRLPLPQDADAKGISVNYDKGVLNIEIPKVAKASTEQKESTKIQVN